MPSIYGKSWFSVTRVPGWVRFLSLIDETHTHIHTRICTFTWGLVSGDEVCLTLSTTQIPMCINDCSILPRPCEWIHDEEVPQEPPSRLRNVVQGWEGGVVSASLGSHPPSGMMKPGRQKSHGFFWVGPVGSLNPCGTWVPKQIGCGTAPDWVSFSPWRDLLRCWH